MSDKPTLSIVIPSFNSAATVEAALHSICAQSWRDYEIIVVDGASTDGTVGILEAHRGEIDHLIIEADRGVYDAMNKGIAAARGEWVYFLGADDRLVDSDVLRDVFAYDLKEVDMVYGDVFMELYGRRYDGPFDRYKAWKHNICHQAIFVRRRVFERLGFFSLEYPVAADQEMNWRILGDPSMRTVWINRVIAHFSAGGRSGSMRDEAFERDRKHLRSAVLGLTPMKFLLARLRHRLRRLKH